MTAKLYLFTLLSFFSISSFAQEKKDNVIIVHGVGYFQVLNSLLDHGYFIDKKENDIQMAITTPRVVFNDFWNYKIQVRVKDSIAYISAVLRMTTSSVPNSSLVNWQPVQFKGMNGGPEKKVFGKMKEFAASLNKRMEYAKQ